MDDTIPLQSRRMSPEEVLTRLRGWAGADEAVVTPAAKVIDLAVLLTDDLKFWTGRSQVRELGRLIEEALDIRIDEWESDWLPPARRTVAELCERIAAVAELIVPEPVTVLGRPCLAAGTFLAVRTLLARAGADVTAVAPSAPVTPFVRRWPAVFYGPVGRMAEGRVCVALSAAARRADGCWLGAAVLAVIGGLGFSTALASIGAIAGTRGPSPWILPAAAACVGGCLASVIGVRHCFIASRRTMDEIELPGLRDFRDLVDTILYRPLRRGTSNPEPAP